VASRHCGQAPVDRDVRRPQGVGAAHRPVTAGAQRSSRGLQRVEGILPASAALPQKRDGQFFHLGFMSRPQRLHIGRRGERREAGDVAGVHHLQMGQVVPQIVVAAAPPGRSHGVQRVADGAVSQRVEVNLEPLLVERGDVSGELVRIDEVEAGLVAHTALAVQVGLEHGGGVILGHPVQHDLHAGGAEAAGPPILAGFHELLDLVHAAVPVPPERAHHVGQQRARPRCPQVSADRVLATVVAADDRVLPAGDPERQQVFLGCQQGLVPVLLGHLGEQVAHKKRGALLQHAVRLPGAVALDPAVRRVRGRLADPSQVEGLAVDPDPMTVSVRQEHRAVRDYGIE
jgi:hypothetical protein